MKRDLKIYLLPFVALAALCGCQSSDGTDIDNYEITPPHKIVISNSQKEIVNKGNDFAFNIWEKICENAQENCGNQIFSPLSLQMVLSMLANGTEGPMLDELVNLYAGGEGLSGLENLNSLNRTLLNELPIVDKSAQMMLANSVWHERSLNLKDSFTNDCLNFYDAPSFSFDIGTEQARRDVNTWCSNKTGGMIPEFLELPPHDKVMLFNCAYFKGRWKHNFNTGNTSKGTFHNESGTMVKTDMMAINEYCLIARDNSEMTYITIPYSNEGYVMNVLMPKEGINFNDCVSKLNDPKFFAKQKWDNFGFATLRMPKFELSASHDLFTFVQEIGVPHLSDMLTRIIEEGNYRINMIKQKARIIVDESGTKAAATTMAGASTGITSYDYFNVTIDRPFFFNIQETSTGAIIFMGKVAEL